MACMNVSYEVGAFALVVIHRPIVRDGIVTWILLPRKLTRTGSQH